MDRESAAPRREDRSDPTTREILAVAAGTPGRATTGYAASTEESTTSDLASRFPVRPLVACPRPRPIEPLMSHDTTVAHRQIRSPTVSDFTCVRPTSSSSSRLRYQSEIRVHYNGNQFNGKSILDLTTLAAECGTRLELEACGPDAVEALDALSDLVSAQFYENENGDSLQGQSKAEPGR